MEELIDWNRRHEADMQDRIVAQYYDYTLHIARRRIAKLPAHVDPDAMVSAALFGLLNAINAFDGGVKAKFRTYAAFRIRGAMCDALRSYDHLSRTDRKLVTKRHDVVGQLTQAFGRPPTDEEIVAETGWTQEQFRHSLSRQPANIEDVILVPKNVKQTHKLAIERSDRFREYARGIDMDGQTLLYLYYYKNATMKMIGDVLGISESRVSQMHTQLIKEFQERGKERFTA